MEFIQVVSFEKNIAKIPACLITRTFLVHLSCRATNWHLRCFCLAKRIQNQVLDGCVWIRVASLFEIVHLTGSCRCRILWMNEAAAIEAINCIVRLTGALSEWDWLKRTKLSLSFVVCPSHQLPTQLAASIYLVLEVNYPEHIPSQWAKWSSVRVTVNVSKKTLKYSGNITI